MHISRNVSGKKIQKYINSCVAKDMKAKSCPYDEREKSEIRLRRKRKKRNCNCIIKFSHFRVLIESKIISTLYQYLFKVFHFKKSLYEPPNCS